MDEIKLDSMVFFGRHGVNPEERELGQRFGVSLSVWLDLSAAAESDALESTVSYAALYKLVRAEVEGEPSRLLERLAGRILQRVLQLDERIEQAQVEVTKLNPPLKGSTTVRAGVVMRRGKAGT